jgi:hypothetical protein
MATPSLNDQPFIDTTKLAMYKTICALALLLIGCNQQPADKAEETSPFSSGTWTDLSYDFSDKTPYWPTSELFRLNTDFEGITPGGYYYSAYSFCAAEHGGTHLDAPVHFAEGKWSTDQM